MRPTLGWAPALVLAAGAVLATAGVKAQRSLPLRAPLAEAIPRELEGMASRDFALSPGEAEVVGVSNYLVRAYQAADTTRGTAMTLYVGYYAQQAQGRTVHSPKNCLPGAGWEPLSSRPDTVVTDRGPVVVNRYLIQNGRAQALVFYWYQGRGRVAHDEYGVKWDLLRDAALKRRSDEALVRIVLPLTGAASEAEALAVRVTQRLVPAVFAALPS